MATKYGTKWAITAAFVRWRHPGIRLVQTICCRRHPGAPVCVCRRRRRVDVDQPSAVEHWQDRPALVCNSSSLSSAAHVSPSTRRSQSEILEFTSTPTSACDAPFRKPLPAALPFFVSCAAFDVRCRHPFTKHSSSPSSCPGWTMAMLCW